MADNKELKLAKEAFDTLCSAIDALEWKYQKDEQRFAISLGVNGDDLPMNFVVMCDAERQLVRLLSMLPFKFNEDKRVEGAVATCHVTYKLADGCFCYDYESGAVMFKMTTSYRESLIGEEMFKYMVSVACFTMDKYNDKLKDLNDGKISLGDFLQI